MGQVGNLRRGRKDLAGKLLGGWQLSGWVQLQSGTPFTVGRADDIAGVGPGSGQQFWSVTGDPKLSRDKRAFSNSTTDSNFWFDRTAFSRPAPGTFGNTTRGLLRNPGFQDWSTGLFKTFSVTERTRVQFRAEVFNWLNHPNWDAANSDPLNASFGRVSTKSGERNLQLSLRVGF